MAKVRLNLRGLEAVATRAETKRAVEELAESVADDVRAQGIMVGAFAGSGEIPLPVEVRVGETSDMRVNRAKAWVNLAHPAGLAVQAKHGALTRAASQEGLEVRGD